MVSSSALAAALCSAILTVLASPAQTLAASSSAEQSGAPTPRDAPFPGVVVLEVDATDLDHRVMKVRESIPVSGGAVSTLLFPQWSIDHAPNGPVDRLSGLRITAAGHPLSWRRDPYDAYAFRIAVPSGVRTLDVSYQILVSLTPDQGPRLMGATMLDLQWPTVLLYPAGYDAHDISYRASLRLPPAWRFASAMEGTQQGDLVTFGPEPMDVLADSPVMGAKYLNTVSLVEGADPVRLNLAADKPEDLTPPNGLVDGYSRLVSEAGALFGAPPYAHYDLMVWISSDLGQVYYEHRQSAESSMSLATLRSWDARPEVRSVFAHDYVHTWNGVFRRPTGMATATPNQPQQADMLWVTEGLTEYWRSLLAVRAGLVTRQEYLDGLADLAAQVSTSSGANWRPLRDISADLILPGSNPEPWPDWQRNESDVYNQGRLIWLEVDALIRQQTAGRRSLDDFAKRFFGVHSGVAPTYALKDIVDALNGIAPYDWAGFFQTRVDDVDATPGLTALERAGYRLVFTSDPSPAQTNLETRRTAPSLRYSLGLTVDGKGKVLAVAWESPAWRAGLVPGCEITVVNGAPYSGEGIKAAVRTSSSAPLSIKVKTDAGEQTYDIAWRGGLRYPHLERIGDQPSFLDDALRPRIAAVAPKP